MIRVNDDYVIKVDSMCYTSMRDRHKTDKNGSPVFDTIGYYSTLKQAVRGIVKYKCKDCLQNVDTDLYGAVAALSEVINGFEDMLSRAIEDEENF